MCLHATKVVAIRFSEKLFLFFISVLLEAVAQRCSVKKVFLEISQNSQENTCARVSFLINCRPEVFSCEFCEISKNTFSYTKQNKSQLKYYEMVLYRIKNLLPIKDILKILSSSGINDYIKILQRQCSRKTAVKELGKME